MGGGGGVRASVGSGGSIIDIASFNSDHNSLTRLHMPKTNHKMCSSHMFLTSCLMFLLMLFFPLLNIEIFYISNKLMK